MSEEIKREPWEQKLHEELTVLPAPGSLADVLGKRLAAKNGEEEADSALNSAAAWIVSFFTTMFLMLSLGFIGGLLGGFAVLMLGK